MPREFKGNLDGQGLRIAIAVSRFNEFVTRQLLAGAVETLAHHGVRDEDITVAWVPGCIELPVVAQTLARTGRYDAIVCLGAVIRGETDHYDIVAGLASRGIGAVGLETGIPATFGVLTTGNVEQAMDRAGGKMGNKGSDAAVAAIETARLVQEIKSE